MRNLHFKFLISLFSVFFNQVLFSQTYITWNPVSNGSGISGQAGLVNVTGTLTPGNTPFIFDSPPWDDSNLVTTGSNTFQTYGPTMGISRDLVFQFSEPVIITRYNMSEINTISDAWDDSFNFVGINFSNNPPPKSSNCLVSLTGAVANSSSGIDEYASWFCSNPVTSFTIDYQTNADNYTHAWLCYSIEVLPLPRIDPVCVNAPSPSFPVVGNNILGTWSPNVIDTSSIGSSIYTFTPAVGQPIQCPVEMTVIVEDCCSPNLTSSTTVNSMLHVQRQNWISSSDIITFSDNVVGHGVVYHAGNYLDLTAGFESVTGSQFAAYPLGCTANYSYKEFTNPNTILLSDSGNSLISQQPPLFKINTQEGKLLNVLILDVESSEIVIHSIDGKIIFTKLIEKGDDYHQVDISSYTSGIYIISIVSPDGILHSQKFIKE